MGAGRRRQLQPPDQNFLTAPTRCCARRSTPPWFPRRNANGWRTCSRGRRMRSIAWCARRPWSWASTSVNSIPCSCETCRRCRPTTGSGPDERGAVIAWRWTSPTAVRLRTTAPTSPTRSSCSPAGSIRPPSTCATRRWSQSTFMRWSSPACTGPLAIVDGRRRSGTRFGTCSPGVCRPAFLPTCSRAVRCGAHRST